VEGRLGGGDGLDGRIWCGEGSRLPFRKRRCLISGAARSSVVGRSSAHSDGAVSASRASATQARMPER
jgi:hypothetical protein